MCSLHGHQHMFFNDYHRSLSGPSFVTYLSDLWDQYNSAADALRTQGLRPQVTYLPRMNVDHAGQLILHTFAPKPSDVDTIWLSLIQHRSYKDTQSLLSRFKANLFSKFSLEECYSLLAMLCQTHGFRDLTSFNVSMIHQEDTTTLHVPKPYILRLYNQHSKQDHILCEYMPDMSVRCTIPTSDLIGPKFNQFLGFEVQSSASGMTPTPIFPIFNLWASQVHHLIRQMEINDIGVQTTIPQEIFIDCRAAPRMTGGSAGAAHGLLLYPLLYLWIQCTPSGTAWWWSADSEGQTTISATEIEDTFDISLDIKIYMWEYHIPQQIYPILWDIHKACGFNPDSTEMAEYLEYPLLEPILEPVHSGYESHPWESFVGCERDSGLNDHVCGARLIPMDFRLA
ncbi:hypothetical protein C8J56DRAFT_245473 [Mycena floridula]|nr:hypothetical protein C8J56DRAFT_245473 [Mycena floridula]